MPVLGGTVGYRMLCKIAPAEPNRLNGGSYVGRSKVEAIFGPKIWQEVRGKTVIDFGCGKGTEAIELAQRGARRVYGIDILERRLEVAREEAARMGCSNVRFCRNAPEQADVIISIDGFEHFVDPASVLNRMAALLKPGGRVFISFGPTWYHPLGGHLFSVFPWAHLIFEESALCKWRSRIRDDGAQKFCEVDGGLNRMTIGRFERLVRSSPFDVGSFEAVPIRIARRFHNRLTRELFSSAIRCTLKHRAAAIFAVEEELSLARA